MARAGDTQPYDQQGTSSVRATPAGRSAQRGDGPTTELSTLVAVSTGRPRRRKIKLWLLSTLILAVLAPPVLGASLLGAVYWQARTDETRPVEAIVVMGTAQYNGRPSPVLRARLDRVVELWDEGIAPLVVVTGGKQEGDAFTEAEASHDYLVERGIPDDAILLEDQGRDSWESLQGVASLLKERDLDRVLIVSDGFHLLRLKKMAHDLGLRAYVTAAEDSPIRPGSANEFSYMIREVGGIGAYIWDSWS